MALRFPILLVAVAVAVNATASIARSDEPLVTTSGAGAPPAAAAPVQRLEDDQSPEAIGAWARGVMANSDVRTARTADGGQAARPSGCAPASPDGKPHGEVWAGAGTGGYREAGGVVTEPLGHCGSLTIGVSSSRDRWR